MVPNVAAAMAWASEASASLPPTICAGRSSTRMSRIASTHACAAMKWAIASESRAGTVIAAAAHAAPIAPIAHGPNGSPPGMSITASAVPTISAASTRSARRAHRASGVATRSRAPHSGVPM